ncbi:hypothetical protein ACEW7V_01190 [Areca yellow leaf disease phytoplasma]|uniref:hypothetical protein n=1 Tax=Areca yellow leaf disease phytoplasma TaxID=927614 RepID=UPI0035B50564
MALILWMQVLLKTNQISKKTAEELKNTPHKKEYQAEDYPASKYAKHHTFECKEH